MKGSSGAFQVKKTMRAVPEWHAHPPQSRCNSRFCDWLAGLPSNYDVFMTPHLLRASSLATLSATFLSFGSPGGAFADGRADWHDYAWQQIPITQCASQGDLLTCPLYHQKWDWKRNQWVDIAITLDLAGGELQLNQRLTDNDPADDDHVCVTVLAVDAEGQNTLAHHQNWYMRHGDVTESSFTYRSSALAEVATIYLGSKQCRDGATQDDALYARVLAGLQS